MQACNFPFTYTFLLKGGFEEREVSEKSNVLYQLIDRIRRIESGMGKLLKFGSSLHVINIRHFIPFLV